MPAENLTFKAQWKANQYTITFDTDGGSKVDPIKQDYGTAVKAPANPTKDGYTFEGWDTAVPSTMPAQDTTLTAKWKANQYTITFDTDGGTVIEKMTVGYGEKITPPADPTKEGCTFTGWDKAIPTTMPAENLTLTAQWEAVKIVIEEASAENAKAPRKLPDTKENINVQATIQLPDNLVTENKVQVLMVSYDDQGRFLAMKEAELFPAKLNTYSAKAVIQNDGAVAKVAIFVLDKSDWTPLAQKQELTR